MSDRFIIPKGGVPNFQPLVDDNSTYFRVCKNSSEYIRKSREHLMNELKMNSHLYEMIWTAYKRRFYIDLDGVKNKLEKKKLNITYDEIVILANRFTDFIRLKYNYDNVITYRIQPSIITSEPIPNTFQSVHIVFDLACQTHFEMNQVMWDFYKMKYQYVENIDMGIYNRNRIFRTGNQSKERDSFNQARKDVIVPVGLVNTMSNNGKSGIINQELKLTILPLSIVDLITTVEPSTPFIVIPLRDDPTNDELVITSVYDVI